jgi:hypothetical protein
MTTVDFRGCGHGTASTETGPNSRRVKLRRPTFTPVRRVLWSGATSFEYERDIQPRPKLGKWTEDLDALLAVNSAKPSREQLTLIWIFEELRGRGYTQASAIVCGCGLHPAKYQYALPLWQT